jgi:hypothetical protein
VTDECHQECHRFDSTNASPFSTVCLASRFVGFKGTTSESLSLGGPLPLPQRDHDGIVMGGEVPWGGRRRLARDVALRVGASPDSSEGPMGREEGGVAAS